MSRSIGILTAILATFLGNNAVAVQTDTLAVGVNGSGSVSSSPAGIDCPTTCTGNFVKGKEVTLTAVAGIDQIFLGWNGACGEAFEDQS